VTALRHTPRLIAVLLLTAGSPLLAAEPAVRNVTVRGLQVGGTTTLTVDGDDLGKSPRLLLPFPTKQTLKPGSTDKQATFDVSLGDDVTPGYHHLRVVTDGGVSLPVIVGVDKLPQRPFTAAAGTLPAALHGTLSGSAVAETTFSGKAGQLVRVEVECLRLGSKLRPVVHLYGPKKLQLAWAWPGTAPLGDVRLEAKLPEDGTYTVTVHDEQYAAAAPGFFRLKIGDWTAVDQVFPPVVGQNVKSVELLGPSPASVDVPPAKGAFVTLPWPKGGTWTGPRPCAEVSTRTEVLEQPTAGKLQELPAGPVGVSGKLLTPREEDRYRVPVTPGTKVRFEVFAERIGSPVDAALVIRNEAGAELARVEDGPGTLDPALEYTVPDKVTAVVVGVLDSAGRGGPRAVYRLTVDPSPSPADVRLTTPAQKVVFPAGGRAVVPVFAERKGYTGPVALTVDKLPGVTLDGAAIPPECDGALVTVTGGKGEPAVVTLRGRGDGLPERPVFLRGHPLERLQPWLAAELAVAPAAGKSELSIDWRGLPDAAALKPTGKLTLPVKIARPDGPNAVRLTLLTSQPPTLLNNQPDPNRSLRPEKPVELAAKVTDGELVVLVPPELSSPAYDVAVQAELLSPDKQKVLATAYTTVRRLEVKRPVALALDGQARIDARPGAAVEVAGTVKRADDVKGDVTVTLTGLPAGITVPPVTVKAADTAFRVKFTLPPATKPGELTGVKLTATVVPDPKQPNARVRSRDVELSLNIE
jgi:hypothetical protein